jgi:hypothetical protein
MLLLSAVVALALVVLLLKEGPGEAEQGELLVLTSP